MCGICIECKLPHASCCKQQQMQGEIEEKEAKWQEEALAPTTQQRGRKGKKKTTTECIDLSVCEFFKTLTLK